jgi:hypothetical protein
MSRRLMLLTVFRKPARMACRLAFRSGPQAAFLSATAALMILVGIPISSQAQDLGVCAAYRQLLTETKFEVTPFCGRPDDGSVPGFTPLKRNYWGVEQIWPIFMHVYEFMLFDDQFHVEMTPSGNPANPFAMRPMRTADVITKDLMAMNLRLKWIRVWSYEEPIDIENDGSPLNVLIWEGYGVTQGAQVCGVVYSGHPWGSPYINQQVFIINSDGKTIDENLTREIFGTQEESMPARLTRQPSKSPFLPVGANPFRPLADTIGIFEYRGMYYIETEDKPKNKDAPLPPVVVYLREHGHTTKVCSIQLKNEPVPTDD